MKVQTHTANVRSPDSARESSLLALVRVSPSSLLVTKTTTQAPVTNTARATTITVKLEEILTHRGYPHGGINE